MGNFAFRTGTDAVGEGQHGTLGARLLRARLEYGSRLNPPRVVTQTDVGREMGVSGVAVGGWESDRNEPGLEKLRALAAFYGVRVSWLAFGELPVREEGGGAVTSNPGHSPDPSAYDRPAKQQARQIPTTRVETPPARTETPKRRKPGALAATG